MAKRFGGQYSPDATDDSSDRIERPDRPATKAPESAFAPKLMFAVPLPMLVAGIGEIRQGDATGMIVELGAFALLMLGAWLLHEGLRAEAAYDARAIAKPPVLPRKILAAILCGAGVGLGAWMGWGLGLLSGIAFGGVATAVHLLAFGLDPLKKKGVTGVSEFDSGRVAEAVDRAEGMLAEMTQAAARFKDRALQGRVETFCSTAREVFRTVEADPRDLDRARKFLGVYLTGARDATVKFADVYARNKSTSAKTEYEALLGDLEGSFNTHRQTLMLDDTSELDVEIEVLRKRLQREGLA